VEDRVDIPGAVLTIDAEAVKTVGGVNSISHKFHLSRCSILDVGCKILYRREAKILLMLFRCCKNPDIDPFENTQIAVLFGAPDYQQRAVWRVYW
jgi:hypothetical protein